MPLQTRILTTKLYRPRIKGPLVPRPRLIDLLEKRRDRPVALVVAPAGYGKTTLVSSWLESCDCPSAWLSLNQDDDDLLLFLSYLTAAIETMFSGARHPSCVPTNLYSRKKVSPLLSNRK